MSLRLANAAIDFGVCPATYSRSSHSGLVALRVGSIGPSFRGMYRAGTRLDLGAIGPAAAGHFGPVLHHPLLARPRLGEDVIDLVFLDLELQLQGGDLRFQRPALPLQVASRALHVLLSRQRGGPFPRLLGPPRR